MQLEEQNMALEEKCLRILVEGAKCSDAAPSQMEPQPSTSFPTPAVSPVPTLEESTVISCGGEEYVVFGLPKSAQDDN